MHYVCQSCNQAKATVHITDTMPEKRERHLCGDCAQKDGVIVKQHQNTNEILQQFINHKTALGESDDRECPKCGMTFREFQSTGQLGCPHDYEAFRSILEPLIRRAHGDATRHVGKVPCTAADTVHRQTGLVRLRRELQDAIEQENYERAARVRDDIRAAEQSDPSEPSTS